MLGVIGGSGLASLPGLGSVPLHRLSTPYGEPSSQVAIGERLAFLPRHGEGHRIAPHEVNYRANVWAMREAGATEILAVSSVGSLRLEWPAGTLVVPGQLIDYTWGREQSYREPGAPVVHPDFTHPYAPEVREAALQAARAAGIEAVDGGTYGCMQGPRFETAAEIDRLGRDGCDLVGMTGMPEAILARELGIPYASLAVVGNLAAGLAGPDQELDHDAIVARSAAAAGEVARIIMTMSRSSAEVDEPGLE